MLLSASSSLHFLPCATDPPYKLIHDHASLSLLSCCRSITSLAQIHGQIVKTGLHNTRYVVSKLLDFLALAPSGDLSYALSVFESMDEPRNEVIWNAMIRGYSSSSSPELAIGFYIRMIVSGWVPNTYTFPFVLKSCARSEAAQEARQIHAHVLKLGLESDPFVHTSLINMYSQLGDLESARLVFDKSDLRDAVSYTALIFGYASRGFVDKARALFDGMPVRDVVAWNAMIAGYAQSGKHEEALDLFQDMRLMKINPNESTMLSVLSACAHSGSLELGKRVRDSIKDNRLASNTRVANALIDMYFKCGDVESARALFEGMAERDVISWNVMIGGYTHASNHKEALSTFQNMLRSNVEPNDVTLLSVLPACAHLGALDLGRWIHMYIDRKRGSFTNVALRTSLIDMYAKCGDIEAAKYVFDGTENKSLSCWNAIISGFGMHGHAHLAFDIFMRMTNEGLKPDDITFVGLLSACSHSGLLEFGREIFVSMERDHDVSPKLQHYGCMIDLLGRSGLFDEAEEIIESMDMEPDAATWSSLLGACRVHKRVELGEFILGRLLKLEPENPGAYVLLSNIYAGANRWDDVARIRTSLNDRGMKKVPGCSSIEIDGVVHEFVAGDRTHRRSDLIYGMLEEIETRLERSGFVADTSDVLYDAEEEWKEGAVGRHSERLAIALGLVSTKPGTTIRIAKNLRICRNCHEATKLISKIFNREIIARDRCRFHRFQDGACSCNDYW